MDKVLLFYTIIVDSGLLKKAKKEVIVTLYHLVHYTYDLV